ncbi:MAG: protein-glutamate O-methyltransferase CheR [Pseudomonadota bacterium]|nr:chemotaxis protein [Gammaproteobacteria bacterium]MEC8010657.1 protein-glutamate O-methyltransferase CheR [Pseudomonadota bacterium]HBF07244.1 chemotaxis protein [Gammaproteobacteria bacterium]|tara:strand:+ start:88983 stop:89840 length:858 start_codon:yes stop_codon:yes gene_type:complete
MDNIHQSFQIHRDPLKNKDHRRVADFIESTAGIQLPESKKTLIETRLRKRQRALQFDTLEDYLDFVLENPEGENEKVHFIDTLTTNKTDFYRESEHFDFIKNHIKSTYALKPKKIRIWSAGCSTGEEPYTLAMEMLELKESIPDLHFEICATDISTRCLAKATKAIYEHDRVLTMPLTIRRKYLLRSKNKENPRIQIAPEVRKFVTFSSFNFMSEDWARHEQSYDFILCRNVMIYFSNADRERLTQQFSYSLKSGGVMIVGHSESLIDPKSYFNRLKATVYQKGG